MNDILDLTRVQACKVLITNDAFECNTMVAQVIALLRPEATKKGVSLIFEPAANLSKQLIGDAGRIKQILVVYLSNALKFTDAGSVTLKVVAEWVAEGTVQLLVTVRDTGQGITLEDQSKLFQPFSQIDQSDTRRHGGIGLGLAIARSLAELMGGSVGVTSSVGRGATFWLRLTLPISAKPSATGIERSDANGSSSKPAGRVLVVEDNLQNQQVALNMLAKLGRDFDLASGGRKALEMIREKEYALVLMDCQMPDLDGYTTVEEMRKWEHAQRRPHVPVIALTAHAMTGDRERCLNAGMNDYLTKPIGLDELRATLDRWSSRQEDHAILK